MPKLLHISPWIKTTGGVETLLARHALADERLGFDAWQLGLFDKTPPRPGERYSTHRFGWKNTVRGMRRDIARSFATHAGSIVAWHNAWGLPWFADLDFSMRRIVCLADNITYFEPLLPAVAKWADGVSCVSRAAVDDFLQRVPEWPRERVTMLPLPAAGGTNPPPDRPPRQEVWIGAIGRMVRPQKRWDRLPAFVDELRRLGVAYRLEVIGAGPLLPWLRRRLAGDPRVVFLGHSEDGGYLRRMQAWDAAIFLADHEGGPIVLLDSMNAGAIPIFPRIGGSLGDDYVSKIDPRCYYPVGDVSTAARALQSLFASPPEQIAGMRRRAHELVASHARGDYERHFADFAQRIARLPRVSTAPAGNRPTRVTDWLPLGLITRVLPGALLR